MLVNNSRSVLFETELALALINELPTTSFDKINRVASQILELNKPHILAKGYDNVAKDYLMHFDLLASEDELQDTNAIDYLIARLAQPLSAASKQEVSDISTIYFFLFQRLIDEDFELPEAEVVPAQHSYQIILSQLPDSTWDDLFYTLMPDCQFSRRNRGRIKLHTPRKLTRDFGITDLDDTPAAAKNWHQRNIDPAKNFFAPDMRSPIVKQFAELDIPFIGGPSGTTGFDLVYGLALVQFSKEELIDYINLIASCLIGQGHHSFYEVMMVAANSNIFTQDHDTTPLAFPFDLQTTNYASFLSSKFKQSTAFNQLQARYPEYLGQPQPELAAASSSQHGQTFATEFFHRPEESASNNSAAAAGLSS